jgi:hypothetical protein
LTQRLEASDGFGLHRPNNDLWFEVPPFEQRWPQFDHGIYCSLSDSFTESLQHSRPNRSFVNSWMESRAIDISFTTGTAYSQPR